MFKKILIANRGEIAVRIIKTAKRLGIHTIALYSDADAHAMHTRLADEAWHLGPAPARESYLDTGKVLRIVTEDKHRKEGKEADPKMLDMLEMATAQKLDSQSTALYGTAGLWDDGLIDPRDTRKLLGFLLDICAEAAVRPLKSNTFGVARL